MAAISMLETTSLIKGKKASLDLGMLGFGDASNRKHPSAARMRDVAYSRAGYGIEWMLLHEPLEYR